MNECCDLATMFLVLTKLGNKEETHRDNRKFLKVIEVRQVIEVIRKARVEK